MAWFAGQEEGVALFRQQQANLLEYLARYGRWQGTNKRRVSGSPIQALMMTTAVSLFGIATEDTLRRRVCHIWVAAKLERLA